uniref:Macoilin n=1 Tax=Parastrongyloides trichosuri TaxID=131310 RepID=A0A0N4ZNH1_PARTI
MIKRTRGECIQKPKRSIKKVSKVVGNESNSLTIFQYIKLFLIWILFLSIDIVSGFRVELLWPFWLYVKNCCERNNLNNNLTKYLNYPDLTFIFLLHIATVDLIFCLFVPVPFMLIIATAWVWAQYIYYSSDKSWNIMTTLLIIFSVLFEVYGRNRIETYVWSGKSFLPQNSLTIYTTKTESFFEGTENMEYIGDINDEAFSNSNTQEHYTFTVLDFCKPFAAHCISYPMLCFLFSLFKYYYMWKESREQKRIIIKNIPIYDIMCEAVNTPKNDGDLKYSLTGVNIETTYTNEKENFDIYDGDIGGDNTNNSKNCKNFDNPNVPNLLDQITSDGNIKKLSPSSNKNNGGSRNSRKHNKCNNGKNRNTQYGNGTGNKKDSSKESVNSEELDDTDSISTASWGSNVDVIKPNIKYEFTETFKNIFEFILYLASIPHQYIVNNVIKTHEKEQIYDNNSMTSEECSEEEFTVQDDDFFQFGENTEGNKDCCSSRGSPASNESLLCKDRKKLKQKGREYENINKNENWKKIQRSNSPLKLNETLNNTDTIIYNYDENGKDNTKRCIFGDKENEEQSEFNNEIDKQLKESNEVIENLKLQLKKKSSIEKDLRNQLVKCEIAEKNAKAELSKVKLQFEQLEDKHSHLKKNRDQEKLTIINLEKKVVELSTKKIDLEKEIKLEKQKSKDVKTTDCNVTCKPKISELENDLKKIQQLLSKKEETCMSLTKEIEKLHEKNETDHELAEKKYEDKIKMLNREQERMQHTLSEETKFKQLLFKALLNAKEEANYLKDYLRQKGYDLPSPRKESDSDDANNGFYNPWNQLSESSTF